MKQYTKLLEIEIQLEINDQSLFNQSIHLMEIISCDFDSW